jgi:hypothetical protein
MAAVFAAVLAVLLALSVRLGMLRRVFTDAAVLVGVLVYGCGACCCSTVL